MKLQRLDMGRCRIWCASKSVNGSASFRLSFGCERVCLLNAYARFARASASESSLEGTRSGTAARCRIPRQRIGVSRVGPDVDAVLGSRDFPIPDHSFVIGKELAFSGDHLFHELARFRIPGREMSNLIDIPMIKWQTTRQRCRGAPRGHVRHLRGSHFFIHSAAFAGLPHA